MSETDEVARFGWVHHSTIQDAACLTFVRGTGVTEAGRRFGGLPEHALRLDFDEYCEEAFAHQESYPVVGVRAVGEWTLVAEDCGFQGTRPEVLRRVSAGSEAVSVFWDADGLARFSRAADGTVRTAFEPLMPGFRTGTDPDGLEPVRAGLPWAHPDAVGLMLALAARITGSPLAPGWLDGEFAAFPVAAWPADLPGSPETVLERVGAQRLWPSGAPAPLPAALHRADPERCRGAAGRIAARVLDEAGVRGEPIADAALAQLAAGQVPPRAELDELVRMRRWELHRRPATSCDRARVRALEVLRQAANPDAGTGLLAALAEARGMRVEQEPLTELATRALG